VVNMDEYIQKEDRYSTGVYSPQNIQLTRGSGTNLYDNEGNKYLDLATGIGVAAVGHSNQKVAEAISKQAHQLLTCPPSYFYNQVRADLMEKLSEISPPGLGKSFLCNSGTEAIEASIKFARVFTDRKEIIATMRGFHGRTLGSLSATWKRKYSKPFRPLVPGFSHVPYGDLIKLDKAISESTAAVLLEPIQGEGGIYLPPEGYFEGVRELCDQNGALLIFDEVQTGFGRTGKMFASEHWSVIPDIMALAKAMGGGMPIGASLIREDMEFSTGLHGSTFGGNPLAASAALATIEYIQANGLVKLAAKRGNYFLHRLRELMSKHKLIKEIRGKGLMLAVQLRKRSGVYLDRLLEHNILALPAGSTVIRFLPPLEISESEIDEVIEVLDEIF